MDNVQKMPQKCHKCKIIIKKPNKQTEFGCLICEEQTEHEKIISYLKGETSVTFMCYNIGGKDGECMIIEPKRDYLKKYSTAELLQEALSRLEVE